MSRLKGFRAGAVGGLNATENNLRMSAVLLAPFLVMWLGIKMLLPDEMYDFAVTIAMCVWLVWVVLVWAYSKSDANNYIVFPQSKWKFPDGTCRTFDVKVVTDGWEKIVEFPDGSVGYRVYFADKYLYEDPDLPYPLTFDSAYWILPDLWDKAFQRRALGEFFHKGVFVTKPDCEDISVYVTGFEERENAVFPVCIINDCSLTYQKTIEKLQLPQFLGGGNPLYLLYQAERRKNLKLASHTAYLEDALDIAGRQASEDFKNEADRRLKDARKRHASIMDTGQSWTTRFLNLKTLAIVILGIAVVWFVGHNIFGVW